MPYRPGLPEPVPEIVSIRHNELLNILFLKLSTKSNVIVAVATICMTLFGSFSLFELHKWHGYLGTCQPFSDGKIATHIRVAKFSEATRSSKYF